MYFLRLFRRIISWDFDLSQAILEGAARGESVCEESLFGRFQRLDNYHNHQKTFKKKIKKFRYVSNPPAESFFLKKCHTLPKEKYLDPEAYILVMSSFKD